MDKRVYRTQKAIISAYLELTSRKGKFTIKEICDLAGINKSTFYRNFNDLDDFKHKAVDKMSEYIIEHIKDVNIFYTDPKAFYLDFIGILEGIIATLGLDVEVSRLSSLVLLLSEKFRLVYEKNKNSLYNHSRALFLNGGIVSFLERNGDVLLSEAIKDFKNNIDLITKYSIALMKC